ncbi:MAG: DNA-methyltransferase [Pseudohongiellaceae bacterium]
MSYRFYNEDCIAGARKHLLDASVDLIICDPPYGIGGDRLDKHYNRNEKFVLDGYAEVPPAEYPDFSNQWIKEAERVLKPGGSMYIVSGYTNLIHILNALQKTDLIEVNHIIWKYNFGVYTKTKYISSHYHILFYRKGNTKHAFNTFCRFADSEKSEFGGSANYKDREDVWAINREYKPGKVKNKNELPTELLTKMIQYSSNENDVVCDFFLGSFSTAKVAKGLNRNAVGFEVSKTAFDYQIETIDSLKKGYLLSQIRKPPQNVYFSQGKPLADSEKQAILDGYRQLRIEGKNKKGSIDTLSTKFGRGHWSILRLIDGTTNKSVDATQDMAQTDWIRVKGHSKSANL